MALCPSGHESQTSDYCDTCGALMGGAAITPSAAAASGSSVTAGPDPGAGAGAGASGQACPHCGTARSGRFCEEDGYDFELAELLPPGSESMVQFTPPPDPPLTPPPVTPPPVTAPPVTAPPVEQPVAPDPLATTTVLGAEEEPGLDLEAELEAAERAAAERAAGEAEPTPVGQSVGAGLAAVVHADQDYYDAQVQRGDIVESDFPFPKYPGERRFALDADRIRIGRASASRGIVVEIDLTGPPLDPAVSHLHAQLLRGADGTWSLVDLNSANGTRLNGAEDPITAETEVQVKAGDRIHLGVWTTITLEES